MPSHYSRFYYFAFSTTQFGIPLCKFNQTNKACRHYLCYALCDETPQIGNLRETFFLNQLRANEKVHYAEPADFIINQIYTIEVGGKTKDTSQIRNIENAYLAIDGIEIGTQQRIPLWLFGFLY
ncbi:MAG: hypothetical protein JEZ09_00740 [Salinivirgaceae bacterium]|nr:hypothetical protein [Salinivirgaceae bacterium]